MYPVRAQTTTANLYIYIHILSCMAKIKGKENFVRPMVQNINHPSPDHLSYFASRMCKCYGMRLESEQENETNWDDVAVAEDDDGGGTAVAAAAAA